ncbi:hypothetical protein TIFTF001_028598 [Ficus carica]|uniref:Uncharacterized protein n=1 Tax=Ficus carica TaxID=3494 RepID=A0AA88J1D2_FICCA|nr:hypothetical protein TIFTF001_028598 [Ficus carica]
MAGRAVVGRAGAELVRRALVRRTCAGPAQGARAGWSGKLASTCVLAGFSDQPDRGTGQAGPEISIRTCKHKCSLVFRTGLTGTGQAGRALMGRAGAELVRSALVRRTCAGRARWLGARPLGTRWLVARALGGCRAGASWAQADWVRGRRARASEASGGDWARARLPSDLVRTSEQKMLAGFLNGPDQDRSGRSRPANTSSRWISGLA